MRRIANGMSFGRSARHPKQRKYTNSFVLMTALTDSAVPQCGHEGVGRRFERRRSAQARRVTVIARPRAKHSQWVCRWSDDRVFIAQHARRQYFGMKFVTCSWFCDEIEPQPSGKGERGSRQERLK